MLPGVAKSGKAEAGQLAAHILAGGVPPPEPLVDWQLLDLFNRTKTLEELDHIDIGRLMRALEAGNIANRYKRAAQTTGAERMKHREFINSIREQAAEWQKTQ